MASDFPLSHFFAYPYFRVRAQTFRINVTIISSISKQIHNAFIQVFISKIRINRAF